MGYYSRPSPAGETFDCNVTTLATRIGTGGEAGIKTEEYGISVYQYVFLLELPIGLVRRTIKSEEGKEGNSYRSLLYRGVICVSLKHLNVPDSLVTFPKSRESRVSRLNTIG